ncbi:MAG: hypothetical protein K2H85_02290 [Allobaculum sp.]|nr:hypothetical protein [Allobaculum sp.]
MNPQSIYREMAYSKQNDKEFSRCSLKTNCRYKKTRSSHY